MSVPYLECGCAACCVRTLGGREMSSSLFVWDPIDYSVEQNHQFDIAVFNAKRPSGDTTSSPYWVKPASADILLWCDENGSSEAARLRFRVQYGQTRTLGFTTADNADTEPLASHFVSCRSDEGDTDNLLFGFQPPFSDVVELLVFVELLVGSDAVQTKRIISLPPRRYQNIDGPLSSNLFTFRNLRVRWHVAISGDDIHVSGYLIGDGVAGASGIFPSPGDSLAFPHFVFDPQGIGGIIQHNQMAVSWTAPPLVSITSSHIAKRKTALKIPCRAFDLSPYCGDGDLAQKPAAWPWAHAGDCNAWRRAGGIVGAPCDSTKTSLQLTIPAAFQGNVLGSAIGSAMGELIADTYELTQISDSAETLADSSFWFSDTSGSSAVRGGNTYTLQAIEMSAAISFNSYYINRVPPCDGSLQWPARILFNISCVIGDGERNVRLTYGFSASPDITFFNGEEFAFRPYVNGFWPQRVNLRVGVWPFFFLSGGSTQEGISYSGEYFPNPLPAPYKVKLI